MTDKVHYWSDLAALTHATQVQEFNFCICEDGPRPYADCPVYCGDCLAIIGKGCNCASK